MKTERASPCPYNALLQTFRISKRAIRSLPLPKRAPLRELPPVTAVHALAERRHRLVGTPRLRLAVRNHLLLALSTLELPGDTLFDLRNHGLVQVLLLQLLLFQAAFFRLHLGVCHDDEFLRWDIPREDALSQRGVGFGFQVLEERAHLVLVGVVYVAGVGVGGRFDLLCEWEDYLRYWTSVSFHFKGLLRIDLRSVLMCARPSYIRRIDMSRASSPVTS